MKTISRESEERRPGIQNDVIASSSFHPQGTAADCDKAWLPRRVVLPFLPHPTLRARGRGGGGGGGG